MVWKDGMWASAVSHVSRRRRHRHPVLRGWEDLAIEIRGIPGPNTRTWGTQFCGDGKIGLLRSEVSQVRTHGPGAPIFCGDGETGLLRSEVSQVRTHGPGAPSFVGMGRLDYRCQCYLTQM